VLKVHEPPTSRLADDSWLKQKLRRLNFRKDLEGI
jgi:hypothetical protein